MATGKQCIYMYVKVFESNWKDLVHSSRPLHVIMIFLFLVHSVTVMLPL